LLSLGQAAAGAAEEDLRLTRDPVLVLLEGPGAVTHPDTSSATVAIHGTAVPGPLKTHSISFVLVPGGVRTTPDDPAAAAQIENLLRADSVAASLRNSGASPFWLTRLFAQPVVPSNGLLPTTPYDNYLRWRRSLDPPRFDHFHPRIGHLLGLDGVIKTTPAPTPTPTPTLVRKTVVGSQ
jgi:hypothetical protein